MTQLPPPSSQPYPKAQHVKRLRPKTYSIAVYLVVAIVLLQVVMVISVFWLRAMVVPITVHPPRAHIPQTVVQAPVNQELIGPIPPKSTEVKPPQYTLPPPPSLPPIVMTMPHPALLNVPGASDKLEQIGNLNDEAMAFQKQHAFESAIETLIKAEDLDPRNPDTLKNMADTYYKMNDAINAKIYWQRLVDLGPAVGTVFAVAKDHLTLLGKEADPLAATSSLARMIYVNQVEKTPVETQNGQAQFHLRATLMRKDPAMAFFDQKKLQPYVIFYQQMPDGSLVPDLGQHKGSFDDTFLFWSNKKAEPFGVDYALPIPGTLGANNTPLGEYYGFVIGIYYNKILQDARSEPSDLITRIPLPPEIE